MVTKNITTLLRSPLSISAERQSQFTGCLDYIPGSTLRGALAQRYLDMYGKDTLFDEIFIRDGCLFSDLLPSVTATQQSRCLPLTSLSCKREPGFSEHGVIDTLWLRAAQQLIQNSSKPLDPDILMQFSVCPRPGCGQDMKTWIGYWNIDTAAPAYVDVLRTETLHTGIDRMTGTVAEKILYSVEAIEPWLPDGTGAPICFNGHLRIPVEAWPRIEDLLRESASFFLGRGRSRGQGEVELKLSSQAPVADFDWDGWNRSCCKHLQAMIKEQVDGCFFSIGLLSDAIIIDQFLRYTSQPNLQLEGAELITSAMRQGLAIGWNQAHGLPKEDEITIARGSVFFYRYPGDINEIKEHLQDLQTHGIGLRRNEGFGEIIVNDPFHNLFCINMEEGK